MLKKLNSYDVGLFTKISVTYYIMMWWKVKCVFLAQQLIVLMIFVLFYVISSIIVILLHLQNQTVAIINKSGNVMIKSKISFSPLPFLKQV